MYYEIVPMDRGHVDQIAELERQCFSTPSLSCTGA